jgi:hypothetical protein
MTAAVRDRATGRFRKPRTFPTCDHCGSYTYEKFDGTQVCVIAWCPERPGIATIRPRTDATGAPGVGGPRAGSDTYGTAEGER